MTTLNARRVWYVVRPLDTASSSASDQNTTITENRSVETMYLEYAKDVTCASVLQGFGKVPIACVMQYQEDSQRMHETYGSKTFFARAKLHSKLVESRYNAQFMNEYIAG